MAIELDFLQRFIWRTLCNRWPPIENMSFNLEHVRAQVKEVDFVPGHPLGKC